MRTERQKVSINFPVLIISILIVFVVLTLGLYTVYSLHYHRLVYSLDQVPSKPVAIVFGAGIWPDGSLSDILADRVDTAIDLYKQGKVQKLLFTGDNRYLNYNEPQRMTEYAIARGVPETDIVQDYAGRRTYDSCYRALHIFKVDSAILVTQAYHLPRALFTADHLGIRVVGVAADRHHYVYIINYRLRELLATPVAWWEVLISHPLPVLGPELPIFPPE
jgi:SanA protein